MVVSFILLISRLSVCLNKARVRMSFTSSFIAEQPDSIFCGVGDLLKRSYVCGCVHVRVHVPSPEKSTGSLGAL